MTPRRSDTRVLPAALVAIGGVAPGALAQTDESLLLKPWKVDQRCETAVSFLWSPRTSPAGSAGAGTLIEEAGSGRVRLSGEHALNPSLGFEFTRLQTRDRGGRIPGVLSEESVALATPIGRLGDWFLAARAGLGYAGEGWLDDPRGWYGKGSFAAGRELRGGADLVFWLDYDGNRTLLPDVPLPHVIYSKDFGEQLSLLIGFPESAIAWRPTRGVELSASWNAPFSVDASASVSLGGGLSVFAAYTEDIQAFHSRTLSARQRLFFDTHRLEAGVKLDPAPAVFLSAAVGYGFRQSFRTGFDERRWTTLAGLPDRPYLGLEARLRF